MAISQIIILQLLIITFIKIIIIVSKYFSFLFEMVIFLIYGVHSMMIALIIMSRHKLIFGIDRIHIPNLNYSMT